MKSTNVPHSKTKPAVFISTYPTKKSAMDAAEQAVKLKLAACVNTVRISSVYSWKGKIESGSEYMSFFKTTMKNKTKLENHIQSSHTKFHASLWMESMLEVKMEYTYLQNPR